MPTTTGVATSFIDFTRASNATVTDSDGKVKWAPHNLLRASEQFDSASWDVKTGVTFTANSTAAPNGTTTADTIAFASFSYDYQRYFHGSALTGVTMTFGVWLWSATGKATIVVRLAGATTAADAATKVVTLTTTPTYHTVTRTFTSTDTNADAGLDNRSSLGGDDIAGNVIAWGAHLYRSDLAMQANTSAYPMYNPTTVKNILGYTESFDNAYWGKSATTATANVLVAPNGLSTADKLAETATTAVHIMSTAGPVSVTSGGVYTFSIYAKAAERSHVALFESTTAKGKFFDLSSGTVLGNLNAAPLDASITAVGTDGWYRCSIEFTGGASAFPAVYLSTNGTIFDYAGTAGSGIYLWGAQLSDSASLDAYVPAYGTAVTSAAYYGPRRDFDSAGICKGLLVEEQRTNRVLQTEDFTVSPWTATVGGTSTIVNGTNTRGFRTATVTATSALGGIRQVMTSLTSGQVYTLSFYIQSTATSVPIIFENGTASFGSPHNVTINPSNGTAGTLTGFTSVTITPLGSGYIYQLVTAAAGGTLAINLEWRLTNSGDAFQIGRPQFENGSFATSYIPTGAATATRNGDVASVSTQAFPYGSTDGTWVANFQTVFSGTAAATGYLLDLDANASKRVLYFGSGSDVMASYDGTTIVSSTGDVTGSISKSASAYSSTDRAVVSNGGTVATGAIAAGYATASTAYLGSIGGNSGTGPVNGWIRQITYLPRRLTNAELQTRTA